MPHLRRKLKPIAFALAALPLAVGIALAKDAPEAKKGVTEAEIKYQAGASPLAGQEMHHNINPNAPPMTAAEFSKGQQIYFERCAGCHGVLRKGATGKALTSDLTLDKGTEYLKVFIAYGSPAGMPNWQTSGEMTAEEAKRSSASSIPATRCISRGCRPPGATCMSSAAMPEST